MTRLKQAWLALCVVALAGCRSEGNAEADYRVLWDGDGCAYYVRPGAGDTSFIRPLPDSDKAECSKPKRPKGKR